MNSENSNLASLRKSNRIQTNTSKAPNKSKPENDELQALFKDEFYLKMKKLFDLDKIESQSVRWMDTAEVSVKGVGPEMINNLSELAKKVASILVETQGADCEEKACALLNSMKNFGFEHTKTFKRLSGLVVILNRPMETLHRLQRQITAVNKAKNVALNFAELEPGQLKMSMVISSRGKKLDVDEYLSELNECKELSQGKFFAYVHTATGKLGLTR